MAEQANVYSPSDFLEGLAEGMGRVEVTRSFDNKGNTSIGARIIDDRPVRGEMDDPDVIMWTLAQRLAKELGCVIVSEEIAHGE
jgi:hypothetical protein